MPPKPKTPLQLAQEKDKIIGEALKIIQKHGLHGLTVRGLSSKLHMSATNIYNYFYNKDEIYLYILIRGFNLLMEELTSATERYKVPTDRLEAFIRAFISFGLQYPAYYQLMFSTQDPKAMDYAGTPIEELAKQEKLNAMRAFSYLFELVHACTPYEDDEQLRIIASRIACELNGGINFYHTNIIRELESDPTLVLDNMIHHILLDFQKN